MANNAAAIVFLLVASLAASAAALRSDWPRHAVTSMAASSIATANVSDECRDDLQLYIQGLGEMELWALKSKANYDYATSDKGKLM